MLTLCDIINMPPLPEGLVGSPVTDVLPGSGWLGSTCSSGDCGTDINAGYEHHPATRPPWHASCIAAAPKQGLCIASAALW